MTLITLVAAKVAQTYSDVAKAEIHNAVAAEALTKGQTVYQLVASGTFGLVDMNDAAKDEPRGMALEAVAAGEPFSYIKYGTVYGFVLTAMDWDAPVFASPTVAGGLDTVGSVCVGRVVPATDRLKTRVLFVDFREQQVNSRFGVAVAEYDFAVDGGVVSAIGLGVFIPDNAVILGGCLEVLEAPTSETSAAQLATHVESAGDIVAATVISGAPWNTTGTKDVIPSGIGSAAVKTSVVREMTLTVTVEPLTAGQLFVFLYYAVTA